MLERAIQQVESLDGRIAELGELVNEWSARERVVREELARLQGLLDEGEEAFGAGGFSMEGVHHAHTHVEPNPDIHVDDENGDENVGA